MSGLAQNVGVTAAVVAFLLAVVASFPGIALGSSTGELTRVQVSADWLHGSFAGTATRLNACVPPPDEGPGSGPGSPVPPKQPQSAPWKCGWIAYATVGPGSSLNDCASAGRRLSTLGPGVQLLWSGEELTAPGSAPFDLTGVSLLYGEAAPLLCLSAVESVAEAVNCADDLETDCPPYAIVHRHLQLAAQLLQPESLSSGGAALPTTSRGSHHPHGRRLCHKSKLRRRHPAGRHAGRKGKCVRVRAIRVGRSFSAS
jgi:hypothetical protein